MPVAENILVDGHRSKQACRWVPQLRCGSSRSLIPDENVACAEEGHVDRRHRPGKRFTPLTKCAALSHANVGREEGHANKEGNGLQSASYGNDVHLALRESFLALLVPHVGVRGPAIA